PSELLVIADETADAKFIAADLIAQAEHGSGYERIWMISASEKVIKQTEKEIERQVETAARKQMIQKVLENNCWAVRVKTMNDAISLANQIAPEHCEIMTKAPEKVAADVKTAGAIFLGNYTPTVLGDYMAGPSHTLPTGGAGTAFSGLSVEQFQRRTSIVKYNKQALKKSIPVLERIGKVEGLEAHLRSAKIRFE
ncbi:MAG TPA: histidinol dehydrogenase, partial [Verrucomicrobiota bacterium]|nr:histidinol dehydrogenase [Verrucomicrobiota bacterium]